MKLFQAMPGPQKRMSGNSWICFSLTRCPSYHPTVSKHWRECQISSLLTVAVADAWVGWSVTCVNVCLAVHTLKGKWLELSTRICRNTDWKVKLMRLSNELPPLVCMTIWLLMFFYYEDITVTRWMYDKACMQGSCMLAYIVVVRFELISFTVVVGISVVILYQLWVELKHLTATDLTTTRSPAEH